MGEIYPPHAKCTRTRGRPFWGGYVYKWGLPLKSHECLQKISVLNTKYHLNLRRTLSYKEIIKALHCCEIYNTISTKKKHFTSREEDVYKEIVLWTQVNKLFLECCYRPVGSSLYIYDGRSFNNTSSNNQIKKTLLAICPKDCVFNAFMSRVKMPSTYLDREEGKGKRK